jgi:hypothetical protein
MIVVMTRIHGHPPATINTDGHSAATTPALDFLSLTKVRPSILGVAMLCHAVHAAMAATMLVSCDDGDAVLMAA